MYYIDKVIHILSAPTTRQCLSLAHAMTSVGMKAVYIDSGVVRNMYAQLYTFLSFL